MTEVAHPIQIVVAYDFSPSSEQALQRAIEIAARAPQHVLHIVAALEPHLRVNIFAETEQPTYNAAEHIQKQILEQVTSSFAGRATASEVQFFVHARIGKPAVEILDIAEEVGADLIIVGSHGKTGIQRLVLGSVSERVVREAGCAVMVVRPKAYAEVERLDVVEYEHARAPHREPHAYTYTGHEVVLRPRQWPPM